MAAVMDALDLARHRYHTDARFHATVDQAVALIDARHYDLTGHYLDRADRSLAIDAALMALALA